MDQTRRPAFPYAKLPKMTQLVGLVTTRHDSYNVHARNFLKLTLPLEHVSRVIPRVEAPQAIK
jgi:hypothetical protein